MYKIVIFNLSVYNIYVVMCNLYSIFKWDIFAAVRQWVGVGGNAKLNTIGYTSKPLSMLYTFHVQAVLYVIVAKM